MVHGDKIAIEMAKGGDQKWVWHSPESVSFNVRVKYIQVVSYTEIVTVNAIW
jgi:hypothetical protein